MNPLFAMDLIGLPFNGTWEISDIGLIILACLLGMRVYQRLDKFEDVLSKRLEAKIEQRGQPKRTEILPHPLIIKPEVRMATHEELRGVEGRVERLERQDAERLQLLTKSLSDLDSKSEERAAKTHDRINLLLTAVGEMRGEIKRMPCSSSQPCPR